MAVMVDELLFVPPGTLTTYGLPDDDFFSIVDCISIEDGVVTVERVTLIRGDPEDARSPHKLTRT